PPPYVGGDGEHPAPHPDVAGLDLALGRGELLRIAGDEGEERPRRGQLAGQEEPQAARAAGHEDGAVAEAEAGGAAAAGEEPRRREPGAGERRALHPRPQEPTSPEPLPPFAPYETSSRLTPWPWLWRSRVPSTGPRWRRPLPFACGFMT